MPLILRSSIFEHLIHSTISYPRALIRAMAPTPLPFSTLVSSTIRDRIKQIIEEESSKVKHIDRIKLIHYCENRLYSSYTKSDIIILNWSRVTRGRKTAKIFREIHTACFGRNLASQIII